MKRYIIVVAMLLGGCVTNIDNNSVLSSSPALADIDPKLSSLVSFKAVENNIPVKFAHAVILTESRYRANVYSHGSYGLGQIKCSTAKGIGFRGDCKQLYNPEINLTYSFKYLRMALDIAKDDECHAASLYQAGLGARVKRSKYCKIVIDRKKLYSFDGESSNR